VAGGRCRGWMCVKGHDVWCMNLKAQRTKRLQLVVPRDEQLMSQLLAKRTQVWVQGPCGICGQSAGEACAVGQLNTVLLHEPCRMLLHHKSSVTFIMASGVFVLLLSLCRGACSDARQQRQRQQLQMGVYQALLVVDPRTPGCGRVRPGRATQTQGLCGRLLAGDPHCSASCLTDILFMLHNSLLKDQPCQPFC
jgi:hypothetical protein